MAQHIAATLAYNIDHHPARPDQSIPKTYCFGENRGPRIISRPISLVKTYCYHSPYHLGDGASKKQMVPCFKVTTKVASWIFLPFSSDHVIFC
jgi:hypothetical protein